MRDGKVDIVVGTHRLLQKDVWFKNLGLVIIDEEQRFGVMHKEKLKSLRKDVDVLTLTATPIPRTLHMALAGVRDMSTMETPPEERLPIKTYVAEYDDRLVREAILRETDRGGQVYFMHNRVHNIYAIAARLQELVPEASFAVAHGQMSAEELEHAMLAFSERRVDVLVCTTIIQAGLDIPNANTLIGHDADTLGLSQLYQLRGRVGRSSVRAYAYLLYQRDKVLTELAEKRLKTVLAATELGAGFLIAMKDLEIRGAGSILGTEQSGHISAVGFDLYTRLLAEAVEELRASRGQKRPRDGGAALLTAPDTRPNVDLPLDAYIPDSYITDTGTRLAVYQKLTGVRTPEEADEAWNDLRDRFGPLPQPVKDLLFAVRARALAGQAKVGSITRDGSQMIIQIKEGVHWDREGMHRAFPKVHVGNRQVRLNAFPYSSEEWRKTLTGVLERLRG
jgi:transcription-repair coupling factor (superfamily II helicase)